MKLTLKELKLYIEVGAKTMCEIRAIKSILAYQK
jgi:hypothetical protein